MGSNTYKFYLFWLLAPTIFGFFSQHPTMILLGIVALIAQRWFPDPLSWLYSWKRRNELSAQISLNPANQPARIELAEICWKQKTLRTAQLSLEPIFQFSGIDHEAFYVSAAILFELGDYTRARERLQQVLAVNPRFKYGEAFHLLALIEIKTKNLDAAKASIEKFLQINNSSVSGFYKLALIYTEMGELAKAHQTAHHGILTYQQLPSFLRKAHRWSYWGLQLRLYVLKLFNIERVLVSVLVAGIILGFLIFFY